MDPALAELVSNTQMPTGLEPDLSASFEADSFDIKMSQSQQKIDLNDFDALENADQIGLNKPIAEANADNSPSLIHEFVQNWDGHLQTTMQSFEHFQNNIVSSEMTLAQKTDAGLKVVKEVAQTALELQGGLAMGKGSQHATETLMRNS